MQVHSIGIGELIQSVKHKSRNPKYLYFFTLTLIIYLINKIKVVKNIKYILKLHYLINYIIVKVHNNYKFYFK
jgi:hypothetical protein